MEPAKTFNNIIIGQFALTGVPVQVYVQGRFLIITDVEDVADPHIGFGMDEDGAMIQFDYRAVDQLSVSGNAVTIDAYNKGMEAKFGGEGGEGEEEPKEDEDKPKKDGMFADKKEESITTLKDLLKEISKDEVAAEIEGATAQIDAAKAKLKASQAAMKTTVKTSKEKIKAAKSQPIDDGINGSPFDLDKEMDNHGYTFGTGDIIKNNNPKCKHFGSQGIVKSIQDLEGIGKVAIYTVTNTGDTYKPGDSLTKTIDQLEPITAIGSKEEEY